MELLQEKLNVEVSEDFEQIAFTMETSKEVFKIWSDTLYSDKITAIIRELSTNAYDAHVAAGKPNEPFTVHLPNNLEPYFSVSDNGTGMSDEFLKRNYTCYFRSDKRKDNTQTGCYGIGSKSPFAYTDNFNIISRYNGTISTYNAFINDRGIPVLVKISETQTTESNGLEVKFAVNKYDFHSFYDKAKNVLSRFTITPKIVGNQITFPKREFVKNGPDWFLNKNHIGISYVVMGNVAYGFNSYDLKNLDSKAAILVDNGVELHMPLGKVQITPSREKISFDNQTTQNIKDKLDEIVNILVKETQTEFEKIDTIWKARLELLKFSGSVISRIVSLTNLTWHGQKLSTRISSSDLGNPIIYEYSKRYGRQKFRKYAYNEINDIQYPIYINDLDNERPCHLRILKEMTDKNLTVVYLLNRKVDGNGNFIPFDDKKLEETGVNEVLVKVSSLPKPDRQPSTKTGSKVVRTMMRKYQITNSSDPSTFWEGMEIDIKNGGYFIPMTCHKFKGLNDEYTHPRDLYPIIQKVEILNGKKYEIYGSNERNIEGLIKNGWINFNDVVKETLEKHKDYLNKISLTNDLENFSYNTIISYFGTQISIKHPLVLEIKKKYDEINSYKKDPKLDIYRQLHNLVKNDYIIPISKTLGEFKTKIETNYPLIGKLDLYYKSSFGYSDIEKYMLLIDYQKTHNIKL